MVSAGPWRVWDGGTGSALACTESWQDGLSEAAPGTTPRDPGHGFGEARLEDVHAVAHHLVGRIPQPILLLQLGLQQVIPVPHQRTQAPLRLAGEQQFAVLPLEIPAAWQESPLDQLAHVPAVALFQQRAQAAGHRLKEPNVDDGRRQLDVPHAFAADAAVRHLHAAAVADDPLVLGPLVLAAGAFPVPFRTKDA